MVTYTKNHVMCYSTFCFSDYGLNYGCIHFDYRPFLIRLMLKYQYLEFHSDRTKIQNKKTALLGNFLRTKNIRKIITY